MALERHACLAVLGRPRRDASRHREAQIIDALAMSRYGQARVMRFNSACLTLKVLPKAILGDAGEPVGLGARLVNWVVAGEEHRLSPPVPSRRWSDWPRLLFEEYQAKPSVSLWRCQVDLGGSARPFVDRLGTGWLDSGRLDGQTRQL